MFPILAPSLSHRGDTFGEKFDSHIRFEKVKNFSQIAA
jgi:hypothetical protein